MEKGYAMLARNTHVKPTNFPLAFKRIIARGFSNVSLRVNTPRAQ